MKSIQEIWSRVLGFVLLVVGILGFFTTGNLLGFGVNPLHNWVHVVSGIVGVWAGWTTFYYARLYNFAFGSVYLLVAILGFFGALSILNANGADHFLHLGIAVVTLSVAFFSKQ